MMPKDLVLIFLYFGHHYGNTGLGIEAVWGGAILLPFLILLFMLARAVFASRRLISMSDESQRVVGKPLLFPVKFNHMRLSPIKDKFNNRFLLVGVPVGLRCRVGNLLAIDDKSLDVTSPPGGAIASFWGRTFSHLSCWLSFDSARFLHRGDHGVDLREKLDNFLISQNEDPAQWPYAYLLGIPQFLGWSRSVVSWWYLYNKDRELDALILEINNSYWEKRNILIRVKPTSDNKLQPQEVSQTSEYLDERQLVQSLSTTSKAKFYGGEWHKYVFASPFEKVDGVVSQRMMDPLQPHAWVPNAAFSNMTTLEETGQVRMATRLICDGAPIDPTQMSYWDVARIALMWTFPAVLTTPEIIVMALRRKFQGKMKMNSKPPVRSGSVGRPITKLELDLEPYFRAYLAHRVSTYPEPVELKYLPCRSFTNDVISMRSPPCHENNAANVRYVTVEPTDPAFYTQIMTYVDVKTAVTEETKHTGHVADPTAQRLIVSDTTLFTSILEYISPSSEKSDGCVSSKRKLRTILTLTRPKSTLSFMDNFVLSPSNPVPRGVYMSSSARLSATRVLAFGSQTLLDLYIFIASCLVRWLILEAFSLWRLADLSIFILSFAPIGWQTISITVVEYFLVWEIMTMTQDWLLSKMH